jgi:acyl-CoA thioester hydrolase
MAEGARPAVRVRVGAEVAYGDCDPGGIAWHGHYWRWFEAGRTALMRAADLDVPELIRLGVRVAVVDARCRYHRALRYGDPIEVEAWVEAAGPAVTVRYRILLHGARAAEARTMLAAIHPTEDRLIEIPEVVMARLRAIAAERSA